MAMTQVPEYTEQERRYLMDGVFRPPVRETKQDVQRYLDERERAARRARKFYVDDEGTLYTQHCLDKQCPWLIPVEEEEDVGFPSLLEDHRWGSGADLRCLCGSTTFAVTMWERSSEATCSQCGRTGTV